MKICVLESSYKYSNAPFKEYDHPFDPTPYFQGYNYELHSLHKVSAIRQVIDLARRDFDVFFNLCDGAWAEDRPGIEVVQALEKLDVPFTGANSAFYDPSREEMKMVCRYWGIKTPAYVLATTPPDVEQAIDVLNFPMIVKHPNSYSSIGMTRDSRVATPEALRLQTAKMMGEFGGTLIEEFIEGREFAVLVAENPDDEAEPLVYEPVEFIFPAGESFKHFDLKWIEYGQMSCVLCTDPELSAKLKEMSKRLFLGLNGAGFGRCDIRVNPKGEAFMLEINPNCGVFYPPGQEGSADYILLHAPGGHRAFVEALIKSAFKRSRKRAHKWKLRLTRASNYGIYAAQAITAGQVIIHYEERPHVLVSKSHAQKRWNDDQKQWFAQYAYPLSDEIYVMWSSDPKEWKPINHSCDPNAWLEGLNLVARRDIVQGEQITMDYATFCGELMEEFVCNCGSAQCRGVIRGGDYAAPYLEPYGEHLSDYILNKRRHVQS
jgi:D-alanine-D-alanine ligase